MININAFKIASARAWYQNIFLTYPHSGDTFRQRETLSSGFTISGKVCWRQYLSSWRLLKVPQRGLLWWDRINGQHPLDGYQPNPEYWCRKVVGSNPGAGKGFHLEISLACSSLNCMNEKKFIVTSTVLHLWQMYLISIKFNQRLAFLFLLISLFLSPTHTFYFNPQPRSFSQKSSKVFKLHTSGHSPHTHIVAHSHSHTNTHARTQTHCRQPLSFKLEFQEVSKVFFFLVEKQLFKLRRPPPSICGSNFQQVWPDDEEEEERKSSGFESGSLFSLRRRPTKWSTNA